VTAELRKAAIELPGLADVQRGRHLNGLFIVRRIQAPSVRAENEDNRTSVESKDPRRESVPDLDHARHRR
jgi:hypothetical protein